MKLLDYLLLFADNLIYVMGCGLVVALIFRYLAYRTAQRDKVYFKTFARGVEKTLESEGAYSQVDDVDSWMTNLLVKVVSLIPDRSLRFGKFNNGQQEGSFRFQDKESLSEFAEGKKSILHGIKQHIDVFKSPYPPNFTELTYKILDQDKQWKTVVGVPIEVLSRMLDVLPGLFVVGGILGTFIGVAHGLPKIAQIDLNKISESTPVLSQFVEAVALSMQASIAGITYMMLMTVLNTLFPIHSSRIEVEKTLERCFEIMWHRIHGNKMSFADMQMVKLLEGIHQELKSSRHGGSNKHKAA